MSAAPIPAASAVGSGCHEQHPEPTQAGNAILLGLFSDDSDNPTWTVSDDKSNTWNLAGSTTDSNGTVSVSSFAPGSQPNVSWQLNGTDISASDATQAGLDNSTASIYRDRMLWLVPRNE